MFAIFLACLPLAILEKENHVSVTYFSSRGDGIFFEESNLSPKEISQKILLAAEDLFDYD